MPLFPRLRWGALGWLAVWVPSYAAVWGWKNFLQLCDTAVFLTCYGLWRRHALFISAQAVGSMVVDGLWTADVGARLITGRHLIGGTEYMWDETRPLGVRLLSLFHVALPPFLLYCLRHTGYDRRALLLESGVATGLLVVSRVVGDPVQNLNFAFTDPFMRRPFGPAPLHLGVTLAGLIAGVFVPTHFVLARLFKPAR